MIRSKSGKIEDIATDGNESSGTFGFAVICRHLGSTVNILFGANEHREDHDEEGHESTTQPNHEVDSELLSPCHSHIFPGHTANPANGKIGDEPGQQVCHKDPSFAASAGFDFLDFDHSLLIAL